MRTVAPILFLLLAGTAAVQAQKREIRIRNVRTSMIDKIIEITYDITGPANGSTHVVDLAVVDNKGHVIYPDSVSGDVGAGVTAGEEKRIIWEIYKEFDVVHGDFTPRLTLDAGENKKQVRGPEYAALSLLLPGLGDYFVADVKEMKIKPYYKTAFAAGMLALSWTAIRNREVIPPVMNPPGWYYTMNSPDPIYINHEWLQTIEQTDYWLFQYDAEIFLGVGVATWLFDVIWVARKGTLNNRVRKGIPGQLSLLPAPQGLLLSYRITL